MQTERVAKRLVVVVVLLAVVPYLNALQAGFAFDDEPQILTNPSVTGGIDILGVLASPLYPGILYRPVTVLSFAINQAVTPGVPAAFHAVNVVLHAGVTVLVLRLALRLFGSARAAVLAAALFAVHPIHTEAVTNVVGRAELLAALFGLGALLTVVKSGHALSWAERVVLETLALACFSLALLSKESGLTVLPMIALLRIAVRGERLGAGLRRELQNPEWVPYVLCVLLFLVLRHSVVGEATTYKLTPLENILAFVPWWVRIHSAFGVLWDYFALLNVPLILAADYSYAAVPAVTSWLNVRCFAGMALVAGAAVTAARCRQPALTFAVLFPFVALALTANLLFPIGTVKAERLLYSPSIGWALLMAYGFDRLFGVPRHRYLAAGSLLVILAGFSARTWIRNRDWKDSFTLYRSSVSDAPDSAKAHYNLGVALQARRAEDAALAHYQRALSLYPHTEGSALGIGIAFERRGSTDQAVEWYQRTLAIDPSFGKAHTNLCHVLLSSGRFEQAESACRRGLRYDPADANLLKGLGLSLSGQGATEEGIKVLQRSLALNPRDESLRQYLAVRLPSAGSSENGGVVP